MFTSIEKLREFNVGGGKPTIYIIDVKDVISIPSANTSGIITDPVILLNGKSPIEYTFQRETPHFKIDHAVSKGADFQEISFSATIPKDRNSVKLERAKFFHRRVVIIYPDNNGFQRIIGSKENPVKVIFSTDHKEQYQQNNHSVFSFKHIQRLEPFYINFSFENGDSIIDTSPFVPEAVAYFNRMAAVGDPLSDAEKVNWNTIVVGRIANGTWYDRLGIYPFKGKSIAGMAVNAKDPGNDLTINGNWIAQFWGILNLDGDAGNYIQTGINPSTNLAPNNHSFGYYLDGNGLYPYVCGAYESATKALLAQISTTHDFRSFSSTDKISITKASDYGHYEMSRGNASELKAHRDGSFPADYTTNVTSSAPNYEFIIGGYNNAGAIAGNWSAGAGMRFFEIGGKKTAGTMAADRLLLVAWLKAEGRYIHPVAYEGIASETNDDFREIQARSVLFTTLEDNALLADMIRLSLQYPLSVTHALKDAIDPANTMGNAATTPYTYFGFKGNGTTHHLTGLFNPNTDITSLGNFTLGIYSRTESNAGCDIGSNDGTQFLEMKIRDGGDFKVNIGTASFSVTYDTSVGHFMMRCNGGVMYAYHDEALLGSVAIAGTKSPQNVNLLSTSNTGTAAEFTTREIPGYWLINKAITETEAHIIRAGIEQYFITVGKDAGVSSEVYSVGTNLYLTHGLSITPIDFVSRKTIIEGITRYSDVELLYDFMSRKSDVDISVMNISQLSQFFIATVVPPVTFSRNGQIGDKVSGVIDTGWRPDTNMSIGLIDDFSINIFFNENYTEDGYILGCSDAGGNNWLSVESIDYKYIRVRIMEGPNNNQFVLFSRTGLLTIERADFKTLNVYHNKNLLATFSNLFTALPNENLIINALNNGSATDFSNPLIGGVVIGKSRLDIGNIMSVFSQVTNHLRGF